jgi:hypothetical protein
MKKYILQFIFILAIAACRPISRGPNPYQAPSPLARGIESPLYARGAIPTLPDGLVAPEEQRSGTIPAIQSALRYQLRFPIMAHRSKRQPCGAMWMAAELMRLMMEDAEQQRVNPHCDNAMTAIAQNRANDMTRRKYFAHLDLDGRWPNKHLAIAGCLPDGYPENGNSVESITLNYRTPLSAWEALKRSPGHRPHVLGTHEFWQAQTLVGVGWSGNEWGEVFVIMTTEGCR